MSQNNIKKDKSVVCCKSCDGKGYNKRNIKLRITCGRCSGSGNVEWINNLIHKENPKKRLSQYESDEISYNILLLLKSLKELCDVGGYKPDIKLYHNSFVRDRVKDMEEDLRERYPDRYKKLKE